VSLRANQIVSGLALTIFAGGAGLSSYIGSVGKLGGQPAKHRVSPRSTCSPLPTSRFLGPIVFHQNALVYASWALVILTLAYLYRLEPACTSARSVSHRKPRT